MPVVARRRAASTRQGRGGSYSGVLWATTRTQRGAAWAAHTSSDFGCSALGRLQSSVVGGRSLLCLYGSVDIAVDVVGPDPLEHSIPVQGRRNRWLHPSKPEGEPGLLSEPRDFRHLGR